jgi:UDP-glucose 4-epimerase
VETSVTALAQAMMRASGVEVRVEHAPARSGELLTNSLDAAKAARVLDWSPQVSLAEGLRATYEWIARESA